MREALAHAKGRLALKTMKVPAKARSMSPAVIAQLRRKLKASTPAYSLTSSLPSLNRHPAGAIRPESANRQPGVPAEHEPSPARNGP